MKRFVCHFLSSAIILFCLVIAGCKGGPDSKTQPGASPAPATQNNASPQPEAVNKSINEVMSRPGQPGASPSASSIPQSIPESMKRPLTIEEICNLPPETRDMILKAQGRPDACAKLKKKK